MVAVASQLDCGLPATSLYRDARPRCPRWRCVGLPRQAGQALERETFAQALLVSQGHAVLLRRPESAVPKRERGHYEERIC